MRRLPTLLGLALLLLTALSAPALAAQRARADVGEIQTTTSRIRGLAATEPVPTVPLSRDDLRALLLAELDDDWMRAHLARKQTAWIVLGMLPPGFDLQASLRAAQGDQVLGFYRTQDRTMYVLDDDGAASSPLRDVVLAHEYTHALQDQHFGLDQVLPYPPPNGDFDLARLALLEGDATATMLSYAEATLSAEQLEQLGAVDGSFEHSALDNLPAALRAELTFPYVEGTAFVYSMSATGTINSVFRRPPVSTEQILHPSRYFASEQPRMIDVPDLAGRLGDGWRHAGGDVMGELDLRAMLGEWIAIPRATIAADGWDGDRWELYLDAQQRPALVLETSWDGVEHAHEFFDAFSAAQRARYGGAAVAREAPSEMEIAAPEGWWRMQAADDRVLILFAPHPEALHALQTALAAPAEAQE